MNAAALRALPWLVASTVYVAMALFDLPRPLYLPERHSLVFSAPEGAIAMGWYGAVLIAGLAGAIARFLLPAPKTNPQPEAAKPASLVILLIFLEAAGLAAFELLRP